jgi:hypothetical protein
MHISAVVVVLLAASTVFAQRSEPGRVAFESRCGKCHGSDGNGGELVPAITFRLTARGDQQLAALIRVGLPARGMPPSVVSDPGMAVLVEFLRSIQRRPFDRPVVRRKVQTIDGGTIEGQVLGEGFDDLQLRTDGKDDKRVRLLRRAGRPVSRGDLRDGLAHL